jgi:hypothetical protein
MRFIEATAMNVSLRGSTRTERRRRMTAVAIVTLLGLAAVSTSARADTLTTFDFSGTLAGSPNSNPATVTGTFSLDQTTGTLAGVDLNTPVGAFTGSASDYVAKSEIQTTSGGQAFQLGYYVEGVVLLNLTFAGTVDGFTGGSLLPQADMVGVFPPQPVPVSGIDCDSLSPGCNGNAVYYNLTSGVATAVIAPAVPEPSTWAMMILGFCGLGFMAYRREQNGPALSVA